MLSLTEICLRRLRGLVALKKMVWEKHGWEHLLFPAFCRIGKLFCVSLSLRLWNSFCRVQFPAPAFSEALV